MMNKKYLSIGEVAALTSLTERTLRFYEERGLVQPIRTASGRRAYAAADLIRINQIVSLRRLSFSVAQIHKLFERGDFDARLLIDIQMESLENERSMIDASLKILEAARAELLDGKTIDLETLCELIRLGEQKMSRDAWQQIYDKYYTEEEQAHWKEAKTRLAADFDQGRYEQQWKDLASRIDKALPMDPASDQATAFYEEWQALLQPFMQVADEQMQAGAHRLWQNMDEWSGQVESPISKQVWEFMAIVGQKNRPSQPE